MCKSDPMAPFNTVGMALHMAATKTISMASVADRPVVIMDEAIDHVDTVTISEYQYETNAQLPHVRFSTGAGS